MNSRTKLARRARQLAPNAFLIIAGGILTLAVRSRLQHFGTEAVSAWLIGSILSIGTTWLLAMEIPELFSLAIGYRSYIVPAAATILVSTGFLLFATLHEPPVAPILEGVPIREDLLILGVLVGIALRMLSSIFFIQSILGTQPKLAGGQLLLAVAGACMLLPTRAEGRSAVASYVIGIGLGILFHFGVRYGRTRRAHLRRRLRTLVEFVNAVNLTGTEYEAIKCFAKRRHRRLRTLLDEATTTTTTLVIVRGCFLRSLGHYEEALSEVQAFVDERPNEATPSVWCLKGILHGELDKSLLRGDVRSNLLRGEGPPTSHHAPKMWAAFKTATSTDPDCLLSNLASGLRKAEAIPVIFNGAAESARDDAVSALAKVWHAQQLAKSKHLEALEERLLGDIDTLGRTVLGSGEVTWTFLIDSYAYAMLKAGDRRTALALLATCIMQDTTFAAPYVHLAELHLQTFEERRDDPRREEARKRGRACAHVAKALEGRRGSRISTRAEAILKCLEPL